MTWSSSNSSVATVSQEGIVSAIKAGVATITVTTEDGGYTATCEVTVTEKENLAVTGVELSTESVTLEEDGKTKQLYAYVSPSNAANKKVTWSSSDEKVATVSSSGLVTSVKPGVATITVTTEDGGHTATCSVTVVEKENFAYKVDYAYYKILNYTSAYSSANYFRAIVAIVNTGNVNIYLKSCSFDFYSSTGEALGSLSQYYVESHPQIVAPGETGYFVTFRTYEYEETENLNVKFNRTIQNAKNYPVKRYGVSGITFKSDSIYGVKAVGTVKNTLKETTSILDSVSVLLFDKEGSYLDVLTATLQNEIASGGSTIFEATSVYASRDSNITIDNIGSYVVFAEAYQVVLIL